MGRAREEKEDDNKEEGQGCGGCKVYGVEKRREGQRGRERLKENKEEVLREEKGRWKLQVI